MAKLTMTYETRAGIEFTFEFKSKMEVCPRCDGKGVHDPEGFSRGFTASEMDDMCDGDPDFREDYFAGRYDVRCTTCNGANVVPVVDESALSPSDRRRFKACERQEYERAAEEAADRRTRWYENGCPQD